MRIALQELAKVGVETRPACPSREGRDMKTRNVVRFTRLPSLSNAPLDAWDRRGIVREKREREVPRSLADGYRYLRCMARKRRCSHQRGRAAVFQRPCCRQDSTPAKGRLDSCCHRFCSGDPPADERG